jgi:arabinoxylan arabinofuranohydrolase
MAVDSPIQAISLRNWEDHGEVLHSSDVPWGVPGLMWAPTAAYQNGKYYLIYPHSPDGSRNFRCGVVVSEVTNHK